MARRNTSTGALVMIVALLAAACTAQPPSELAASPRVVDTTLRSPAPTQLLPDTTVVPTPTTTGLPSTVLPTTVLPSAAEAWDDITRLQEEPSLLWIGTYLGYTENLEDVTFILASDGSVLRVNDRNIYAGSGSYQTWNIGPEGYNAVVELVNELGVVDGETDAVDSNEGQVGSIRAEDGWVLADIRGLHLGARELTAEQWGVRSNFDLLLSKLEDMTWMEEFTTVTQRVPWVPDRLTLEIRNEDNPQYYTTDHFLWPFEESLDAMVDYDLPDGERAICLEGADAETAWNAFVIDGVNNARIPIEAGGNRYEVTASISFPMYQINSDPCEGATEFNTSGADDRAERRDLRELLLSNEDLGPEWSVGSPSVTSPPPDLPNCDPLTDGELAVDTFDSWITHTVGFSLDEGAHYQYLGTVPEGEDAVGVVERVGTYSCLDGMASFGVIGIESGMLANLPVGVEAAAYWILTFEGGVSGLVIDAALENGLVMVLGTTDFGQRTSADLDEIFAIAAEKALSDG